MDCQLNNYDIRHSKNSILGSSLMKASDKQPDNTIDDYGYPENYDSIPG